MIALDGFFGIPYGQGALIILNLIIIESLLSVDNAAVLASMAMKLPKEQRGKALRYGILGAYIFRGVCLVLAGWLIHIWWLKPVGGAYLLFLAIKHFVKSEKQNLEDIKHEAEHEADDVVPKSKLYKLTVGKIGPFWGTVIAIEVMDLAFSLDNVLAAVAYTDSLPSPGNLYLLWVGVFIGILAMRFVAQGFVKLMERFSFLETSAFLVIGLLGVKLILDGIIHLIPHTGFGLFMEDEHNKHMIDLFVSLATIGIFVLPILFTLIFRRKKSSEAPPKG